MKAFTLVGCDGNAFAVMGYTATALKAAGLNDKIPEMRLKAMSGDYNNLICVCCEYIDIANDKLGLVEEDDYDDLDDL